MHFENVQTENFNLTSFSWVHSLTDGHYFVLFYDVLFNDSLETWTPAIFLLKFFVESVVSFLVTFSLFVSFFHTNQSRLSVSCIINFKVGRPNFKICDLGKVRSVSNNGRLLWMISKMVLCCRKDMYSLMLYQRLLKVVLKSSVDHLTISPIEPYNSLQYSICTIRNFIELINLKVLHEQNRKSQFQSTLFCFIWNPVISIAIALNTSNIVKI